MNPIEFRLRPLERHLWAEPSRDLQPGGPGFCPPPAVGRDAIQSVERYPEAGAVSGRGSEKLPGSDANHREGDLVDRDRASDGGRVGAKASAPEGIADYGHGSTRGVVGGREEAAVLRRDAKHGKEIAGIRIGLGEGGCAIQANSDAPQTGAAENAGQGLGVGLKVLELRVGEQAVPVVGGGLPQGERIGELYEALGSGHGQRAHDDGVQQAEDGGIGADSQRQGQDDGGGESGAFAQCAQGVAQILAESLQGGPSPGGASVLH